MPDEDPEPLEPTPEDKIRAQVSEHLGIPLPTEGPPEDA